MKMKRPLAFLLLTAVLAGIAIPTTAGPSKELQSVKGRVAYQAPNGAVQQIAVKASIVLADQDLAITGANSLAALTLPDTSRVLLGSNTRVRLAFFNRTAIANAKFILYQGRTRFHVEHPMGARANYTFQTPTAQIAVRGTVGDIFVDGTTLQLNVYSLGDPTLPVRVTLSNGKIFYVHAGQAFIESHIGNSISQAQIVSLTAALTKTFIEFNAAGSTTTALLAQPLVIIPIAATGILVLSGNKNPLAPTATPTPVPGGLGFQRAPTPPPAPMPLAPPAPPAPGAPHPPRPHPSARPVG